MPRGCRRRRGGTRLRARLFPDDDYDLSPATFADVDPRLTEPGLAWGAAKAFTHLQRHRPPDQRPNRSMMALRSMRDMMWRCASLLTSPT